MTGSHWRHAKEKSNGGASEGLDVDLHDAFRGPNPKHANPQAHDGGLCHGHGLWCSLAGTRRTERSLQLLHFLGRGAHGCYRLASTGVGGAEWFVCRAAREVCSAGGPWEQQSAGTSSN